MPSVMKITKRIICGIYAQESGNKLFPTYFPFDLERTDQIYIRNTSADYGAHLPQSDIINKSYA